MFKLALFTGFFVAAVCGLPFEEEAVNYVPEDAFHQEPQAFVDIGKVPPTATEEDREDEAVMMSRVGRDVRDRDEDDKEMELMTKLTKQYRDLIANRPAEDATESEREEWNEEIDNVVNKIDKLMSGDDYIPYDY